MNGFWFDEWLVVDFTDKNLIFFRPNMLDLRSIILITESVH